MKPGESIKHSSRQSHWHGLAILAFVVYSSFAVTRAQAGVPGDPSSDIVILQRCKIEYAQSSLVGMPESGMIGECLVRRGEKVTAGQLLARIWDGEAKAEVSLREVESRDDFDVRLWILKHDQALFKLRASTELRQRNALSASQLKLDQVEADLASVSIEQAKFKLGLAKVAQGKAEAALRLKQIVSPHDGIVSEVLKRSRESAVIGSPLFRVDNIDRLQIVGRLDVVDCWRVTAGLKVRVRVDIGGAELPIEREPFAGSVVFVDTKVDPLTQTCMIVAEVENQNQMLRAGLEASIEIDATKPAELGPTKTKKPFSEASDTVGPRRLSEPVPTSNRPLGVSRR